MPINGIKKIIKKISKEPIRYILVGGICQLSDYLITIFLFYTSSSLFISNTFGYTFASIFSYIGHSKYTFKKKSKKLFSKKQIILFIMACLAGIISGYIVLKLLSIINLNIAMAKLLQLGIIAAVQYFFNSKITFKN